MVREHARRGSIVYIPSHKSHIDYLVLNYILLQYHMHIPRVAAGKNLAFWPMGTFFRKSGAFFIRRTFKGAKLYAMVFTRYIKALLQEGHPLEFYIEGGRSRSGKLILPKIGFLSILIEAHKEGFCEDLVFVPASISYDRILEERSYLRELGGGTKEKETFRQVWKARHFLKKKYGKIYLRFGTPVSFNEYLEAHGELTPHPHRTLALHLIRSINRVTLVTPLSLVASAILTTHRRGFHLPQLMSTAKILFEFLLEHGAPTATTLADFEQTCRDTMSLLISWKVVNTLEDVEGEEVFYYVDDDKKPELEYYKNSIIHNFISHSFVAISLLAGTEEVTATETMEQDYSFMKHLFRHEFIFDEKNNIRKEIEEVIAYFSRLSYVYQDDAGGGYRLTRLGFDTLPMWAGFVKTFLESYWIASRSNILQETGKGTKKSDPMKTMNFLGQRFHKLGVIDHVEAISHLTFKNALKLIREDIVPPGSDSDENLDAVRDTLLEFSQKLYDLSHYRA